VVNEGGERIAALSGRERDRWAPHLHRLRAVTIRELLPRAAHQSSPQYRHLVRQPRWVVPLVDVDWEPPPVPEAGATE
jgi:hypothetical protein